MRKMEIMDITIRDAQQCLWATRMSTSEMVPIARTMDEAGFSVIDLMGGAGMDSSILYLGEDLFERARTISRLITKTPLNFNTRGQSIFRWMQYADDVTEFTLTVMRRNGIRSVMVFDALNDMRNLEFSIRVAKRLEMYVIGAVTYTISPVHTDEHFVQKARDLVAMGADAIELKDPVGILTPERARQLIPLLRAATQGVQLQLHSHCTFGHGLDTYLETLSLGENGVDLMHCASRPLAYGYSLPSHDAILDALPGAGYSTPVDRHAVDEMQSYFSALTRRTGRPEGMIVPAQDADLGHQVPGGMMSNMVRQLSDQGHAHRVPEVLEEVGRIREDLGYPIIVSPMAQYIGTQAVLNVLTGKRYQMVPQEIKQYVLGYYGKLAAKVDPEVRYLIAGDEQEISVPPGQLIEPMMPGFRKQFGNCESDEMLATRIFYSAQNIEENKRVKLLTRQSTLATNAAAFLAKELLGAKDIEVCEIKKKDFYFSMNRNETTSPAAD